MYWMQVRSGQVDSVYTDLTKAFDRTVHYKLLDKIYSFGLSNTLIHLFRSYVKDRTQRVAYRRFKSVTSGVL